MSKRSNIALAIVAGAVIGGIVAIALKAQNALDDDENEDSAEDDDEEENIFGSIARQFSERLSSDLKAAENKIKSAVKKDSDLIIPEGEFGVFL